MLDALALEIESWLRDLRAGRRQLCFADQASLFFGCMLLIGIFLPWLSLSSLPTAIGLTGGGFIHVQLVWMLFAIKIRWIQKKRDLEFKGGRYLIHAERRQFLYTFFIGFAASLMSLSVLLYYIWIHANLKAVVDVRYGFYVSLLSGMGIAMGGMGGFFKRDDRRG